MSFSENGTMSPADYAAINGNNGWGNGFGGDGWWIILLLLLAGNGGWGGFGGFGGGYEMPYFYNQQTQNDVSRGFENQSVLTALGSIASSINNGFADAAVGQCNQTTTLLQTLNNNQNATTQAMNSLAMGLQNCCCENRAGLADLRYTIATEECATRANSTQNTQNILNVVNGGIQSIKDQLCQDKIDAKNDEIAQLRQEILYARGQASQVAQNSAIINGVYNRLNECPVGTVPVYGEQPIFTCNNGGCNCGNF